ncbi:MAG: outer membrane beta-barrel protein [Muribaculaceae bacterium]
MMRIKYTLIITFILGVISVQAENYIIKADISTSDASPATVYRATVEYNDTVIKQISGSFFERSLILKLNNKGKAVLTIDANGYETKRFDVNIADSILNLGNIVLKKELNINLSEVTVKAKRIEIERMGADYTIRNIQGTHLGNAGNLMDMLKWTPGVTVQDHSEISVVGKGKPLIYINDRKIMSDSELVGLQSSEVSRIEIIRDPDARYKNGTNAVKDYLGASVSNNTLVKRNVGNRSQLNLNGKFGIVSGTASIEYRAVNNNGYISTGTEISNKGKSQFSSLTDGWYKNHEDAFYIFGGLNFDLSKKSNLSVQYSGIMLSNTTNGEEDVVNEDYITSKKDNWINRSYKPLTQAFHNASASYQLVRNKFSALNVVVDYAKTIRNFEETITEENIEIQKYKRSMEENATRFNIYTLSSDYTFKIGKEDDERIGIEAAIIDNNIDLSRNTIPQNTELNNYWGAVFGTFHRWWGKFNVTAGLRYEYDYTNANIIENLVPYTISKTYSNLLPSIRVAYLQRKGRLYSISYNRSISRPDYNSLDPYKHYEDSLHYTVGNPNLKPEVIDKIAIVANIGELTLAGTFKHSSNKIDDVYVQDETNNNVTYSIPNNIGSSDRWIISGDYSLNIGDKFSSYLYATIWYGHNEYKYLDKMVMTDHFSGSIYANLQYNFYKNFDAYLTCNYGAPYESGNMKYGYSLRADFGISSLFFKKKFYVALEVNDIFASSAPKWTVNSLNTVYWRKYDRDRRGVNLTLRYTFNSIQTKFKKKSGNEEILNRTN